MIKKFENELYPVTLYVVHDEPEDKLVKYFPGSSPEDYRLEGDVNGRMLYSKPASAIILLFDKIIYRNIVHECTHAAYSTFTHIGAELSPSSDECFAYLVEYYFDCVMKTLGAENKKK